MTFEDPCDPAGLHLRQGHDGSEAMDETHHCQCGMFQVRGKHVLVESHAVATPVRAFPRQVGEIVIVAGGKDNGVHLWRGESAWTWRLNLISDFNYPGKQKKQTYLFHSGAIRKHHGGAAELLHVWLDDDRPGEDFQRQVVVDDRDFTEESARAERDVGG